MAILTDTQISCKNVSGSNEQLLAQVCHLHRADCQHSQQALHHEIRMLGNHLLIHADNVSQERQSFDLCCH